MIVTLKLFIFKKQDENFIICLLNIFVLECNKRKMMENIWIKSILIHLFVTHFPI